MSYARMNKMTFVSKDAADEVEASYAATAPDTFADATILIFARTGDTTASLTSIYPDKDSFERSAAARKTRMATMAERIADVAMEEGEVALAFVR